MVCRGVPWCARCTMVCHGVRGVLWCAVVCKVNCGV